MKKIYILGNNFYGYEKEIINELSKNNIVKFIDYTLNIVEFFLYKIFGDRIKIFFINRKLKVLRGNADLLLFIGGKNLTIENLMFLERRVKVDKKFLYLWDNIDRVKNVLKLRNKFDKIFSFDRRDCQEYNFIYRPTFYSSRLKYESRKLKYNFFFVGVYRENRYKFLKKIVKKNNFIYLYHHPLFYFIFKIIKRKEYKKLSLKNIRFTPITREKYNTLFLESKYIIDIPESNQTGLTQRILDCLFMQKKIITTQHSIKDEEFFKYNNILIIEDNESLNLEDDFFKSTYNEVPIEIIKQYSIQSWANDIIKYL